MPKRCIPVKERTVPESISAKVEWLRTAAREGFDAADRGDYVALRSREEVDDFLRQIRAEVSAELAAERERDTARPLA